MVRTARATKTTTITSIEFVFDAVIIDPHVEVMPERRVVTPTAHLKSEREAGDEPEDVEDIDSAFEGEWSQPWTFKEFTAVR
ncbi:hypothetical protein GCM10010403_49400 [Glycomyces rutgersensis]|uniref:Uncharacterized protein n=1 Tax=Glycomyces rutgersensis TaxID=58115 RepID=A0ABN3GE31_9ACTN